MSDNNLCASLNYEAECERLNQELKKAMDEAHYLSQELKFKEEEMKARRKATIITIIEA